VRDTAIGCHKEGGAYRITLAGGGTIRARHVVLACGHFDPARLRGIPPELDATGRYHHDAWAGGVFGGIGPNEEVVLIGTGLTTVDVVMRPRENGHRGRITAVSRHALFPERHAPHTTLPAPIFEPGTTAPTARAYLRAFHAALRRGTDWRAAVDSMRPVLNDLWLALPDMEKLRFRRHLQRRWEIRRHLFRKVALRPHAPSASCCSSRPSSGFAGHEPRSAGKVRAARRGASWRACWLSPL
jgi:uncharacterized NAD(P)/FAD-binding protein YdhS